MKRNISFFVIILSCIVSAQATTASFTTERNCINEKTILQSTSTSKDIIIAYLWDLTGNQVYNDRQGSQVSYPFPSIGNFDVGLKIITDVGDTVVVRKQITIYDKPHGDFSVSENCSKDSTYFKDNSTLSSGLIENYLWIFGDGISKYFKPSPHHRYNQSGNFDVTLITITEFGCRDTFTKGIVIYPTPEVILSVYEDSIFFEDDSAEISVQDAYDSYVWSTGETTNKIKVKEEGLYSVDVVDANNCPSSAKMNIIVLPKNQLTFVEIVTPNNDGINDYFRVINKEGYKQVILQVFNRNGVQVYEADNYQNDWGGTYNGKLLPEGTYYYVVEVLDWNPDRNKVYKGSLSILH
ncbi:gliding motility-associated C-terminal domain-containing protein [Bacteroidota bacterium]